jgi:murein DD-endopeptidase MepM/ murein hydrolase activator NlpD
MKRSFLLGKKSLELGSLMLDIVVLVVKRIIKIAFTKRTVLFVTNEKIRSVNLGPLFQLVIVFFIAWIINLFNQSVRYHEILDEKSQEISRLKSMNSFFEDEFDEVNDRLKKINEYLSTTIGSKRNVKDTRDDSNPKVKLPQNIVRDQLSKRDKNTLNNIIETKEQIADIQNIARDRIKKIELVINTTGLNIKKSKSLFKKFNNKDHVKEASLNNPNELNTAQGGPRESGSLDEMVSNSANSTSQDHDFANLQFSSEIDYLMVLERLTQALPFNRPMKNYYISSTFGIRVDPITQRYTQHNGLDFVGVTNEKIISPSAGKVILAGRFSDYGNAVVIDHGYGITTRYGHLSSLKVNEGDIVKSGQVIAFQGSTGRSTGAHLHYEIRYKNIPLNPRKFLEAGQILNDSNPKYVNS